MTRQWFAAVCYGMAASFIIILSSAFLLASLLRFTSFSESGSLALPLVISAVALFVGGVFSGSRMKKKGLLIGAVTGLFYCFFSFFFQFLGLDRMPGTTQYLFYFVNVASAAVGGAVGVNLFSGKQ